MTQTEIMQYAYDTYGEQDVWQELFDAVARGDLGSTADVDAWISGHHSV